VIGETVWLTVHKIGIQARRVASGCANVPENRLG
jgi:hypothetical protein